MLSVVAKRWRAWRVERETEAEVRETEALGRLAEARRSAADAADQGARRTVEAARQLLEARRLLLEERYRASETELEARARISRAATASEEEEDRLRLHRVVRQTNAGTARQTLGAEIKVEKLLTEREGLRQRRLTGGPDGPPQALPAPPGGVEPHLSDRDIERLALRAVTRIGALPTGQRGVFPVAHPTAHLDERKGAETEAPFCR